jgi:hypothetical protein
MATVTTTATTTVFPTTNDVVGGSGWTAAGSGKTLAEKWIATLHKYPFDEVPYVKSGGAYQNVSGRTFRWTTLSAMINGYVIVTAATPETLTSEASTTCYTWLQLVRNASGLVTGARWSVTTTPGPPALPTNALEGDQVLIGTTVANASAITSTSIPLRGVIVAPRMPGIEIIRALGKDIIAASIDTLDINSSSAGLAMLDGEVWFEPVFIPKRTTVSGVGLISSAPATFTPDNNCKVGLYRRDGNLMTKLAESVNNTAIFTQPAGTYFGVGLTTSPTVDPGLYYVAILANWSAVTVAPAFHGTLTSVSAAHTMGLAVGAHVQSTGHNDLPASTSSIASTRSNRICAVLTP